MRILLAITLLICMFSCTEDMQVHSPDFLLRDNASIGIDFSNELNSTNVFNVYKYRNFYNGGGVGLGDINNDGFIDIYFVSNQSENKLYLNKGGFQFEDITHSAGVAGSKGWSTGVSFADVNGDGFLDIYVCNSGDLKGDDKKSELFINNGDLTFSEKAEDYGLDDEGYSTHASFFDYDKDGDLDVYLLNNSYAAIGSFNLRKNQREVRDELGGDKLMRNDDGRFVDVSSEAGIYGSEIGFGLGVTVSDFNSDSWLDIFISNDFFERDYLYMNQGDGTFKEDLVNQMHSISAASMGADAADINNDGYTDIFVTDMLPYQYERLKTVTTFDDWNRYSYNVKNDYHHQFTRNVLHLNNKGKYFNEVSRFMGIDASDWSWGALFFDMDNDGYKDLFIANGIYRDITNQDYLEYIANESIIQSIVSDEGVDYKDLIDIIPSNKVANMSFRNINGIGFQHYDNSGLNDLSFSNGSAFGDLDNDGDQDLVVNNINMPCFVYENVSPSDNSYLRVKLLGDGKNKFAIGARVEVIADSSIIVSEHITCKGFQSSVDNRLTLGLGKNEKVDLQIQWPSGKISKLTDIEANQEIVISESDATQLNALTAKNIDEPMVIQSTLPYVKTEAAYSDFNQERLIFWMRSNEGGKIASGDINGDSIEDLILPGSKDQLTEIWLGTSDGDYQQMNNTGLESDLSPEYVQAVLSDIDGDSDLDLLLAAGGVEHSKYSPALKDKLYLNNGMGKFTMQDLDISSLPKVSTSSLVLFDYDGDGDDDMLVTERVKVAQVGAPCSSYLMENDGKGGFYDVTKSKAAALENIGMVTDAMASDMDSDGDLDIVLVGECMPITCFENVSGHFEKASLIADVGLSGFWSDLHLDDIDGDGDIDIFAGNYGLNSRFRATPNSKMRLYYGDFDSNGFGEGILCHKREDGRYYPYSLRHNLIDQMKKLKKKFPDFETFKNASIEEIIDADKLNAAVVHEVDNLESSILMNEGNWSFKSIALPHEIQFSNVYAIASGDYDGDGDVDILMGGNQYRSKPEMGISDASRCHYLDNNGHEIFVVKDIKNLKGEIRDIHPVRGNRLVVNTIGDSLKIIGF